jgi:hypothetical protein
MCHTGSEALELTLHLYLPDFLVVKLSTTSSFQDLGRVICQYKIGDKGQIGGYHITPRLQRVKQRVCQWMVG